MNFLMPFQLNNLKKKNYLFEKYYTLGKNNNIREIFKKASISDEKKIKSFKTFF